MLDGATGFLAGDTESGGGWRAVMIYVVPS